MPKALDVAQALKVLFTEALAGAGSSAQVVGLDGEDAAPDRIGAGRVLVEQGTPGKPTIDLSPPTYNYEHVLPVTVEAASADDVAAILAILSAAIEADRFLNGLVDYLDATAPDSFDETEDGAPVVRVAPIVVTATYSTPHPL